MTGANIIERRASMMCFFVASSIPKQLGGGDSLGGGGGGGRGRWGMWGRGGCLLRLGVGEAHVIHAKPVQMRKCVDCRQGITKGQPPGET